MAYGFLVLVTKLQQWLFTDLPGELFSGAAPAWWPVPWVALAGLLTALTIRHLPGTAGHFARAGASPWAAPRRVDRDLPGVALAALATLSLGAVLGPEAPLIAIGWGLAALTVRLVKKDAPPMAVTIMASAGSFAAISTLFGSPLLGAFLIMEAAGIAGATLTLVALPGLLASGIGALVFLGLDSWTGLGTFSLALTSVPPDVAPTIFDAPVGAADGGRRCPDRMGDPLGRALVASARPREPGRRDHGARTPRRAVRHASTRSSPGTARPTAPFSGQDALPALVADAADYSVGVLVLLGVCKGNRVRPLPQRLPWGARLPGDVHRGGARDAGEWPARDGPRARDRDGHRRLELRHAQAPR